MYRTQELPPAAIGLAGSRAGIVRRGELIELGMSKHAVNRLADDWTTLAPGVYALDGDTWTARVHAGVLLGGTGAAAFGVTAAGLYGLAAQEGAVHVLAMRNSAPSASWLTFHHDRAGVRRVVDLEPPRCSLDDAVIDGAGQGSEDDAIALISRALQERRTTPERLAAVLTTRPRLQHRALLADVIGDSADGAHSVLEHRYLRDVERAHQLPPSVRQYVVPETGYHADSAHPAKRLLIELNGVRFHDVEVDRDRDNLHATYGYLTLRLTWQDVLNRPCHVAAQIARALGVAIPRSCRRCR